MNKAYAFLLKKRYAGRWRTFRRKLDYYLDFSMVYLIFLGFFFILFYRSMWIQPPMILQGLALLVGNVPPSFYLTLSLLLFVQFALKGLTTPPMSYSDGDTYFLFTLPISRMHYLFFQWFIRHLTTFFIVLGLSLLLAPLYHILYPTAWVGRTIRMLVQIFLLAVGLINVQWLTFQLPRKVKRFILTLLRYIRIISAVLIGVGSLFLLWRVYFLKASFFYPKTFVPRSIVPSALDFDFFPLLLVATLASTAFSIALMKNTALESLKEASQQQNQIRALQSLGMMGEAKKLDRGKSHREKRYFLAIPGYYRRSKIFLWRNLSQFIKQPGQMLMPYGLYGVLGIGMILATQGNAMAIVFIFFALYILGQQMVLPLREHYEANYFLSSFPVKSIDMVRGYLLLPFFLSTVVGLGILGMGGWYLGSGKAVFMLGIVLPFFSYYTLLTSMKNLLEEIHVIVYGNKALHMELFLLLQGIAPMFFAFVLLGKGLPVVLATLGTGMMYAWMARELEKSTLHSLQKVFHKYS